MLMISTSVAPASRTSPSEMARARAWCLCNGGGKAADDDKDDEGGFSAASGATALAAGQAGRCGKGRKLPPRV